VSPLSLLLAWFSFQVPFQGESAAKQGDTAVIDSNAAHAQHNSFFIKSPRSILKWEMLRGRDCDHRCVTGACRVHRLAAVRTAYQRAARIVALSLPYALTIQPHMDKSDHNNYNFG
jgi:hypothetical protein